MELWLLPFTFILLAVITYFVIQRTVASLTRTPVWLLWLVMMTPPLVWIGWTLFNGKNTPIPPALLLGPFVICLPLYWLLIQWGRPAPNSTMTKDNPTKTSTSDPVAKIASATEKSSLRPITKEEEKDLRNCFPWGIYYLQNIEYRPQVVLCRGKLRTNPEQAYRTVRSNIEAEFGDRFFVVFQESFSGKPFFALVPNTKKSTKPYRGSESLTRPGLALGLMVITLFTTTWMGTQITGVSENPLTDPAVLLQGLPYALALMAILSIHELGHYFAAMVYKVRTTLPYFIPIPFLFLGTLGAFIHIRSPVPNRKALFDIGIAGPLVGLVVTLPILMWGLAHSTVVPLSDSSGILNLESLDPRFSLLLSLLSKWALGSEFVSNTAINLHPVAVAGYVGLVVTAFNLMPVGQLDGGHIVHAMLGQRTGMTIGQITRLLMMLLVFIQPELLLWGIILLFMPVADEPALNDVSELDNWRDLCGIIALLILVTIILPVPGTITKLLTI
ncbi:MULTISPECIES: site-2 protease family protein [Moorena]|uniref:Putative membrane-associated Zn-dependent protease 1 n=1 Tax=Moorena producens 3L TaxID=489825 RepID=F4XXD0_9CYAN|nr:MULTISPECIES: site-2 protease family protein [Moorena]NES81401.1 site-2 protease family protein [Moorena sp. SIO2B7]EGJ30789.1 putative membrane-associated Zn-dependent protease 1 [Moorena producens 3L]NEP33418.1 site-2 protease family protein [Moorena sp. SIO3B2]NEP65403.1 site-2 protease family protein [Moorena sp. SIO3A5]NEQ05762.1 site-2 protease family protein [Moorena sp. SIO4E2]